MFAELKIPLLNLTQPSPLQSGAFPQGAVFRAKPSCAYGRAVVPERVISPAASPVPANANDPGSLFDLYGRRKYLNADERARFIAAAATYCPRVYALCLVLHATGCRISEALAICPIHLDPHENVVILQTLKQRRRGVFRMMPVPEALVDLLGDLPGAEAEPVLDWHRSTAWEKVTAVMRKAGIEGPQACPRGTRHGFGVAAVSAGVPITLLQRWLGHARLETTSIYLAVTGPEERDYAAKIWRRTDFITNRKDAA